MGFATSNAYVSKKTNSPRLVVSSERLNQELVIRKPSEIDDYMYVCAKSGMAH